MPGTNRPFYTLNEACDEIAKHVQFDRCYKVLHQGHLGQAHYFNLGEGKNVATWFPGLSVVWYEVPREDGTNLERRASIELPERFTTSVMTSPSSPNYDPVREAVLKAKLTPVVSKIFDQFDSLTRAEVLKLILQAIQEK